MTSTVTTNPIILAVAERLYRMVRARDRRIAPVNVASDLSARRAEAADRAAEKDTFDQLTDDQKAGWYREAETLVEPMLTAAAEAYSRSGCQVLPEHLDVETEEAAEKVGFQFVEWRRAFRSSTEQYVQFPNHAVGVGLAALAALRDAFGWTPTRTAPEIVDTLRADEQKTEAGDQVRLHLTAAHAYPIALGTGDGEAEALHSQMHGRGQMEYEHDPADLRWSEDMARHSIDVLVHEGYGSEQFLRPLREHLERAPHTVAYDVLRLHLLSSHCLVNAAELRDHEVADAHEHEHNGPGTIRNHPREDHSWTVDKVHLVLDGMRDDPDELKRYLDATGKVMARLKDWTS